MLRLQLEGLYLIMVGKRLNFNHSIKAFGATFKKIISVAKNLVWVCVIWLSKQHCLCMACCIALHRKGLHLIRYLKKVEGFYFLNMP